MKTKVEKWDLVIYDIGNGIEEGAVLDVFDDAYDEIRVDTDGVIYRSAILYIIKGAGKQNIYDQKGYEDASYKKWLYRNYGLEIRKDKKRGLICS